MGRLSFPVFRQRPDATLSQAAPVQNTWYTILDTTLNVLCQYVLIAVATTAETLECRWTMYSVTRTGSQAAVAGTTYYIRLKADNANLEATSSISRANDTESLPMRRLKVEVRKTTATGAGTITGRVKYGTIP